MHLLFLKLAENQVWWCTPVIPALLRLRQEDRKSIGILGYIVRPLGEPLPVHDVGLCDQWNSPVIQGRDYSSPPPVFCCLFPSFLKSCWECSIMHTGLWCPSVLLSGQSIQSSASGKQLPLGHSAAEWPSPSHGNTLLWWLWVHSCSQFSIKSILESCRHYHPAYRRFLRCPLSLLFKVLELTEILLPPSLPPPMLELKACTTTPIPFLVCNY